MSDEARKKKYTVYKTAFFTEEIRAKNRQEAREEFEKLQSKFATAGDYSEGHTVIDDTVCPRCQNRIDEKHGNKESCEHCGLGFANVREKGEEDV